jgi:putative oxidoreductase
MWKQIAHKLVGTDASLAPAVTRVALGSVMFAHGAQKAFGWFGGYGFEGTMGFLTGGVGLPAAIAFLVIAIELVGSAALIVGAGGRLAAAGIVAVMVGAVATAHAGHGFFMNWGGNQAGEGFEYHILAIALAAVVMIQGSGAWSIDRLLGELLQGRSRERSSVEGARHASYLPQTR